MATNQVNSDLDFQSVHQGLNVPTPSLPGHISNKQYVDDKVDGLAYKEEVYVRTTANITLSGEQTLDGSLTSGSRVLVMIQTLPAQNGIYVSAAGAWARASDLTTTSEANNATVMVTNGSTWAGREFTQTTKNPVIGTDPLVWAEKPTSVYTAADSSVTVDNTARTIKTNTGVAANTGLEVAGGSVRVAALGFGITGGAGTLPAVDTSVIMRWKSQVTHSSGTTVTYTHNLGKANLDYIVSVFGTTTHAVPGLELTGLVNVVKAANSVTVTFGVSQSANTIGITVGG